MYNANVFCIHKLIKSIKNVQKKSFMDESDFSFVKNSV